MFDKPHHTNEMQMNTKYNSNCHTTKTCLTNHDARTNLSLALDVAYEMDGTDARTMLRHMLLNGLDQSLFWMAHSELPQFSSHCKPQPEGSGSHSQTEDTPHARSGQSVPIARRASKSHGQRRSDRRH